MSARDLHALLDSFRLLAEEAEWLEFKEAKANFDTEKLGQYFCALANEANLKGRAEAWLILGVHDTQRDAAGMRAVVGTTFKPTAAALNDLKKYIADHTAHRTTFREIHQLTVGGRRVLMLEIPASPSGLPMTWKGHMYGRDGSSIVALSLAELDQIRGQNNDWSAEVIPGAVLADLDPDALAFAREAYKTKHPSRSADATTFLNKTKVTRAGAITRTAILLLGREESAHFLSPADPRISWALMNADGTLRAYEHYGPPYILATTRIAQRIRNTPYTFMRDSTLFPDQVLQYDQWVLREILHNAVAHQDYALHGRINVVEWEDSLIISNPGSFLPGTVLNVITADSPPDRYRNRFLATAMVELNMIDTLGSGIAKSFRLQRQRGFPMPDYDFKDGRSVVVTITGKILDENYTRALLANTALDLRDVVALDRVQKRAAVTVDEFKRLKAAGLIEGRRPNIYVSAVVAAAAGRQADYVHLAGFDDPYYKDLVLKLIDKFGSATPAEIQNTLLPKLPDAIDKPQKRNKIRNLVQDLVREGIIHNVGKHGPGARWERVKKP